MRRTTQLAIVAVIIALCCGTAAQAGWPEGVAAFKAKNFSQAATEFQAVVEDQPDWPGGHFMLGWTYLSMSRNQDALTSLRKAYDLNPNDVTYQLRLGQAYVANQQYSNAVSFLGKINPASLPKEMQGFLAQLRAVAYTKTGQEDRALSEFAKAVQANPDDADLQYQYGSTAFNAGDMGRAIPALSKATQLDPGDANKKLVYTQALLRQGRTAAGSAKTQAYRQAAQAAAALVATSATHTNLMLHGEALLGGQQYDQAITVFQQAAAKDSGDWLALYYTGQAYTVKNQYRSAEAALKQALNKTSNNADKVKIWKQLGFVYEKQKKYTEATSAYRQSGDQAGMTRVEENRKTNQHNQDVEEEAQRIQELRDEQDRIKEELEALPGAAVPQTP